MEARHASDETRDEGRAALPEGEDFDAALAALAKGLAHPARVAILRKLMALDGCFVGRLVEDLPLAQSTISQHLRKLKEAGLIKGEIEGPRTCYCVDPEGVARLCALVAALGPEAGDGGREP